jgi:hypothetical protein
MAYFDPLISGSFKTASDGRRLFFPWGIYGRGYVIPSEEEYERLRHKLRIFLLLCASSTILVSNILSYAAGFFLFAFLAAPHILFLKRYCSRLEPSTERHAYRESFSAVVKRSSVVKLWLFEIASLAACAYGFYLPLRRGEFFTMDYLVISLFVGMALIYRKMIVAKRQEQRGGRELQR